MTKPFNSSRLWQIKDIQLSKSNASSSTMWPPLSAKEICLICNVSQTGSEHQTKSATIKKTRVPKLTRLG